MTTDATTAIRRLRPGSQIAVAPGCGTPVTLLEALAQHADAVAGSRVLAGLLIGEVPVADAVLQGTLEFTTWHVSPPLRVGLARGRVSHIPMRNSHVPGFLDRAGVDVAFVRVSPPDRNGYCSLGPSVSYPLPLVRSAPFVVAEVAEDVPRTLGRSFLHRDELDLLVEAGVPGREYDASTPTPLAREIAAHVMELLPARPTVQLGIGEIPEALTEQLADFDEGPLRFVGMGSDGMVELYEGGTLDRAAMVPEPAIKGVELMGTKKLWAFVDENPAVGVYPVSESGDPRALGGQERFVSINSAFQVDLLGQVNAEWLGGTQRSGIGGSADFVESALTSPGGVQVIALRSTTRDGQHSRIVPQLAPGTPVTVPRHAVQFVVTEHGSADLRGLSMPERAERLVAVAHPDHRDALADAIPDVVGASAN